MKRSTQITTAQHSLLCIESYLELLKREMSPSEYVACINTHSQLSTDRLYRGYEEKRISLSEYEEAKSIIVKVHNAYLKKGNVYV